MNKSKMFCFRLSEKDFLTMQLKAKKAGLNMSAYVTTSALQKDIVVISGLTEFISELKMIGRNINQLTTLCNMGKIKCADLSETKENLKRIYTRLSDLMARGN